MIRRCRSLAALLCLGIAACAEAPAPEPEPADDPVARALEAGAVDTVGVRNLAQGDTLNTMAGLTIIDRMMTFPPTAKDGEVFAWEFYAETLTPVKLFVVRRNEDQLELVGESPMVIPRHTGINRLELPEPIPIRWRDMYGIFQPEVGPVPFRKVQNWKTLITPHPFQRPFTNRDGFAIYGWRYSMRVFWKERAGPG